MQGYQGHQNVSKRRPHHSGDICTTRENNLKTIFSFMGQNVKKNVYFGGILGALRGSSMIRLNLSCFPAILSPISMYMWNKEAIWKDIFKFKPKIWKNNTFFFIFGGSWGALRRTQVNKNFRALRPHNRADKFITREKNNHQFFIYGPQCEKMRILGYSGGAWVAHK